MRSWTTSRSGKRPAAEPLSCGDRLPAGGEPGAARGKGCSREPCAAPGRRASPRIPAGLNCATPRSPGRVRSSAAAAGEPSRGPLARCRRGAAKALPEPSQRGRQAGARRRRPRVLARIDPVLGPPAARRGGAAPELPPGPSFGVPDEKSRLRAKSRGRALALSGSLRSLWRSTKIRLVQRDFGTTFSHARSDAAANRLRALLLQSPFR